MRRIGYLLGVVSIAVVLFASYGIKLTHAAGCCGTKEASAAENADSKCAVCGKAIDKGKGVKAECKGKTFTLCCDACAEAFKKDPCKYCDDKKCEKHEEHHGEGHH